MPLTRRTTFRLYPTPTQTAKLFEWRHLHQWLYNQALSDRQVAYRRDGQSVNYFEQQRAVKVIRNLLPEFKELGSHALQATLKRVDFAYQRFFKGVAKYPRFKSIRNYSGWSYPDSAGWKAHSTGKNGYIEISNLGQIQMRGQARMWGTPTTCTIVHRRGKWYASITVVCDVKRVTGTGAVGLDFGCLTAVAMSDGTTVENPRYLASTQSKIKKASRQKRRRRAPNHKKRVKASNRWRKAQKRVSKLQNKAANQRKDWSHKVAAQIVSSNSMVATEKLNLKGMTKKAKKGSKRKRQKTGLNRSLRMLALECLKMPSNIKLRRRGEFTSKSLPRRLNHPKLALIVEINEKKLSQNGYTCARNAITPEIEMWLQHR